MHESLHIQFTQAEYLLPLVTVAFVAVADVVAADVKVMWGSYTSAPSKWEDTLSPYRSLRPAYLPGYRQLVAGRSMNAIHEEKAVK